MVVSQKGHFYSPDPRNRQNIFHFYYAILRGHFCVLQAGSKNDLLKILSALKRQVKVSVFAPTRRAVWSEGAGCRKVKLMKSRLNRKELYGQSSSLLWV